MTYVFTLNTFLFLAFLAFSAPAQAGELRERLKERLAERAGESIADSGDGTSGRGGLLRQHLSERRADLENFNENGSSRPSGGILEKFTARSGAGGQIKYAPSKKDLPYGEDKKQKFDVYIPPNVGRRAPVLFIVHGGAWKIGDKDNPGVVGSKASYWLPKGYIIVSTNYRLLPDADPLEQAKDVAKALGTAQKMASVWGGNANDFVVMGHSAGAHLVALLASNPSLAYEQGAQKWRGTVVLDSAVMDVPSVMEKRHMGFYDEAFGSDPSFWEATSPRHQLSKDATPMLVVCSTERNDNPCGQAEAFIQSGRQLNISMELNEQNLSHGEIMNTIGESSDYTRDIDAFITRVLEGKKGKSPRKW